MQSARVLHAPWILPGDGPAIADGAVVVGEDGAIVEVGRAGSVIPRHAGLPVEAQPGVLSPGFVNAHTHLELTWMSGRVPPAGGFAGWVDRLVALRAEETEKEAREGVARALDLLARACVAGVGDVSNTLWAEGALAERGFAGSVFHEVFGLLEGPLLDRIRPMLEAWRTPSARVARAPAPHTLYTTHPSGVRALVAFARARGLVTSIHMAEHAAEREAIERGSGAMPDWFEERVRIPRSEHFYPREPLFDYAARLGVLGPDVLLVHMTDARPDELARARDAGSPIVLCPRSNLHIEGRLPDAARMLDLGLEPALGTDWLASSPSLDVRAEGLVLVERAGITSTQAHRMATWSGARSLGRLELGRLAPGARPGVALAPAPIPVDDPAAHVLSSTALAWVVAPAPPGAPVEVPS